MVVGQNHTSIPGIACLLSLATCLISSVGYSQKINNVDFEVVGNQVNISYDIDDCSGDKTYDLRVMLGKDGQLTEIRRGLRGDVESVSCGPAKTITWDVLSDREELSGRIYFAVEIYRTHQVIATESDTRTERSERDRRKEWVSRSWKADKGYVGGSIGMFSSFESYSNTPRSLTQGGAFVNVSIGYLPSLLLGVSTTVYVYSDTKSNAFDIKEWKNWGVMIGPLISLPLGNRIKWELKPQVGYSAVSVTSGFAPDSLSVMRAGVACNIGAGLRLNIGKRTCYMLNVEYMSAPIRFDDYPAEANLGTIGASFGIAFRFY